MQQRYKYGSYNDNIFNTTVAIRNMSNTLWFCIDSIENYSIYVQTKLASFGDPTNILTAFIQNLLANIINMNNIYKAVVNDFETGNDLDIYY